MEVEVQLNACNLSPLQGLKKQCTTPKISEKNQLFHVQYFSNGLMRGTIPLYLDFISKWAQNFQLCILQLSTKVAVFFDSYLQNGHNFIQCICDGKHTRTKVMNLNDQSDYFATFQFKARDSAPKNCLLHYKQKRQSNRFLNHTNPFSFSKSTQSSILPVIQGYSATFFFCNPLLLRVLWAAGEISLQDIQPY